MIPPLPNPLPARKDRAKLDLTREQACELLDGFVSDLEIVSDEQVGHRRWSVDHLLIIKRISDGKHFSDTYSVGATESQDERPWEYGAPDFRETYPVERVVVDFV